MANPADMTKDEIARKAEEERKAMAVKAGQTYPPELVPERDLSEFWIGEGALRGEFVVSEVVSSPNSDAETVEAIMQTLQSVSYGFVPADGRPVMKLTDGRLIYSADELRDGDRVAVIYSQPKPTKE